MSTKPKKALQPFTSPIAYLALRPLCEYPDSFWTLHGITAVDKKALHMFAKRIIAASRLLYKQVPRKKADPVVTRKWLEAARAVRRK